MSVNEYSYIYNIVTVHSRTNTKTAITGALLIELINRKLPQVQRPIAELIEESCSDQHCDSRAGKETFYRGKPLT